VDAILTRSLGRSSRGHRGREAQQNIASLSVPAISPTVGEVAESSEIVSAAPTRGPHPVHGRRRPSLPPPPVGSTPRPLPHRRKNRRNASARSTEAPAISPEAEETTVAAAALPQQPVSEQAGVAKPPPLHRRRRSRLNRTHCNCRAHSATHSGTRRAWTVDENGIVRVDRDALTRRGLRVDLAHWSGEDINLASFQSQPPERVAGLRTRHRAAIRSTCEKSI